MIALKENNVAFEDLSDVITIIEWSSSYHHIESIEFGDGSTITEDTLLTIFESEEP
jgi:hypothetical protein